MSQVPDRFGPGERQAETQLQGETTDQPSPHGEMPSLDPAIKRRTQELTPVTRVEVNGDDQRQDVKHRTGTDQDAMRPVRVEDTTTEHRLDHSAHDWQREEACDPAQDNVGPQSDRS